MAKDYSAILILENGVFKLNIVSEDTNDKEHGKSILEDDSLAPLLLTVSKLLQFESLEEMLQTALQGDDLVYTFDQNIEAGKYYDLEVIKSMYEKAVADVHGKYESKIQKELEKNIKADFAAAALERACEVFAYKALNILKVLAISKLIIDSASMVNYERLINLFAKNAGNLEINLEIK